MKRLAIGFVAGTAAGFFLGLTAYASGHQDALTLLLKKMKAENDVLREQVSDKRESYC